MRSIRILLTAACLVSAAGLVTAASAQTPAAAPKGEGVMASAEVTATVTKVDQKTREVKVKTEDGKEHSFIASADVKNLAQF